MTIQLSLLLSAFLTGLIGSIHCVGMCGGITGALTMGTSPSIRRSLLKLLPYLIAYNSGRILSYITAGAIVGLLSSQITHPFSKSYQIHQLISGIFLIILGFYLAGWWQGLLKLEQLGSYLWRFISPLGKYFLPVKHAFHAFGIGLVWGWLPCGLVYTALALSLAGGSSFQGSLIMLAFGLGTLPMLFLMGMTTHWLTHLTRRNEIRMIVGILLITFGIYITFTASNQRHCYNLYGISLCAF